MSAWSFCVVVNIKFYKIAMDRKSRNKCALRNFFCTQSSILLKKTDEIDVH